MRGLAFLTALAATPLFAAPPSLDSVFPPGGRRGSEVEVTLEGKFDPWPCSLWFSAKGFSFVPDAKKAGVGKIKIPAEAAVGPVFLRAHNAEGASAPVLFAIDDRTEILEEEKDGSAVGAASPVDRAALPLVISGRLAAGGELDAYHLSLEKGETLHVAVEAYALRSPIDPAIHLHDVAGNRLALAHDGATNLDPLLAFSVPEKGDAIVALAGFAHPPSASVVFAGSKNANYRLHLALDRKQLPKRLLPLDPGPDTAGDQLSVGQPVVGTLPPDGAKRRYKIAAKKGDRLLLRVEGRSLGFPIDPVLRLLKADGAEIRREDDSNKMADPEYLWTVAADGEYFVDLTDRFSRGGGEMRYRLSAAPPVPGFDLSVDKSAYVLERGKPVEVKVTLTRRYGHTAALELSLPGLPEGLALTVPEIPEKGGEVILKLEAKEGAPAFAKPLRLEAKEKGEGGSGLKGTAVFSLKDDNARGPYLADALEEIWFTLPPLAEKKADPKEKMPAPEAKKPAPAAKKPAPEVKKPTPEAKKPAPEVKSPAPEAKAPAPEAKAPAPEVKAPAPEVKK